ncbi:proton-coupled amino acid transporter-like protein acs [Lycorma delicatula]|uniref:proton-coupled amino acid transporter-like protein acs n=1 Tax=Lycorma delicatula TaxID=130591 RepID=UPI003F5102C8
MSKSEKKEECLRLANDMILQAKSKEKVNKMLEDLGKKCEEYRMKISNNKTKSMIKGGNGEKEKMSKEKVPHTQSTTFAERPEVIGIERTEAATPQAYDSRPLLTGVAGTIQRSRSVIMRTITTEDLARSSMYIRHPTTYIETLMNMIKLYMGNGMFAMGYAFSNSGLVVGVGIATTLMIITIYSNHTLIHCAEEVKNRLKIKKPPDMAETVYFCFASGSNSNECFAITMKITVQIFIVSMQIGICCVIIVFTGATFKMLIDGLLGRVTLKLWLYLILFTIPMLATALIKDLKYLAPLSFIANILLTISTFIVIFLISQDLPPISSRKYVGDFHGYPIFFGTFLFAVSSIGMTIPLRNEMEHPYLFNAPCGVLNVSMFINLFFLLLLGVLGYLKYGDDVKGSVTLNLEADLVATEIMLLLIALSIMFSFALQFFLAHSIIWSGLCQLFGDINNDCLETTMRVILVLLILLLSEVIPDLGLIMSFSGALSCSALLLFFPQVSDIVLRWPKDFGDDNKKTLFGQKNKKKIVT